MANYAFFQSLDLLDEDQKKMIGNLVFTRSPSLPPSSGPCKCLPGKRENRENLLRERRRGGGDATDGERGGVTAERGEEEEGAKTEKDELVFNFSLRWSLTMFFYFDFKQSS